MNLKLTIATVHNGSVWLQCVEEETNRCLISFQAKDFNDAIRILGQEWNRSMAKKSGMRNDPLGNSRP